MSGVDVDGNESARVKADQLLDLSGEERAAERERAREERLVETYVEGSAALRLKAAVAKLGIVELQNARRLEARALGGVKPSPRGCNLVRHRHGLGKDIAEEVVVVPSTRRGEVEAVEKLLAILDCDRVGRNWSAREGVRGGEAETGERGGSVRGILLDFTEHQRII